MAVAGAWFVLLAANVATGAQEEKIPPLRPAKNELGASFWELYGWLGVLGFFVIVGIVALLIVFLSRARPRPTVPPQLAARRALEALRGRADDPSLVIEVSRIFRRYLHFALDLPPGEWTTSEFGEALRSPRLGNVALGVAAFDFLRRCDERKFAPQLAAAGSVNQRKSSEQAPPVLILPLACNLIDRIETLRQQKLEAARREGAQAASPVAA